MHPTLWDIESRTRTRWDTGKCTRPIGTLKVAPVPARVTGKCIRTFGARHWSLGVNKDTSGQTMDLYVYRSMDRQCSLRAPPAVCVSCCCQQRHGCTAGGTLIDGCVFPQALPVDLPRGSRLEKEDVCNLEITVMTE